MEPESPSPYPQMPATYGGVIPPLEKLPHGDPSGGVVYLRIVLSPEEASQLMGKS